MKGSLYHYESCGLPDIWLRNGFVIKNTQYGEAVSIHNLDGLHHTIGLDLVNNQPGLSSDEIRFLRKEMDFPQTQLASLLSVSESTVRNWENGRVEISGPADRMLRALYLEVVQGKSKVRDMLVRISQLNQDMHEGETREYTEHRGNWLSAA